MFTNSKARHAMVAKSYVIVTETSGYTGFDVESFFAGRLNHLYVKLGEIELSDYFADTCQKFDSLEALLIAHNKLPKDRAGMTPNSVYVLELACSVDEIDTLVAQGRFSKGVIRATRLEDFMRAQASLPAVRPTENPRFNKTQLEEFLAKSVAKKTMI